MQLLRLIVFNILFYFVIFFVFILAIPTLILPNKTTLICGKILAHLIIFLLKFVLRYKDIFSELENLKKIDKFFVASAHQSLLETFILQKLRYNICFILKKSY